MSETQGEAVETTEATETQTGEQPVEQQSPDILGQIDQRLNEWGTQLPGLVSQAVAEQGYYDPYEEQQYGQQQPQQGFQQEQDPYNGLDPNDPIQARLIQAEQRLQQFEQSTQGVQRDLWSRDLQGVLERYPEINPTHADHNPQATQAVMSNLRDAGFDVNGMVPTRALEMAYKAYRADQIAGQQKPLEESQQASLETSAAQHQEPEANPIEEIFGAPQGPPNPMFSWAVK